MLAARTLPARHGRDRAGAGAGLASVLREPAMTIGTILLILLVLLLIGAIPSWPHSRNWGYGPSGVLGIVLIIIVVLLLTGRL